MATQSVAVHTIPLVNGRGETIVDADVYEWASRQHWYRSGGRDSHTYVAGAMRDADGVWRMRFLHRLILNAPRGVQVDHINRDPLDNRRCNLRLVTSSQNHQNSVATHAWSGIRGVHWQRQRQKWQARIRVNGHRHSLGLFASVEAAATAVAEARLRLHPYAPLPADVVQP